MLATAKVTSRRCAAAQSVATPAGRPRSHGTTSTSTSELAARISSATACQDAPVCGSSLDTVARRVDQACAVTDTPQLGMPPGEVKWAKPCTIPTEKQS